MATTSKIMALIPCYNEGSRVSRVVSQARAYLPVLVVDDGSRDDSAVHAETAGATVLRQIPNQGKGRALMSGFQRVLELGCDAVIMLDADGQHDSEEIPRFLDVYSKTSPDLIIGRRDFHQMPPLRQVANTIGTGIFSWAIGQHIYDNQSGYRMLSRRMMEATLNSKETNFEFEVEMIVLCVTRRYRLSWVPISTIYGDEKSHIKPVRHMVNFLRLIIQTRRATHATRKTK